MWTVGADNAAASSAAKVVLPAPLGPSMATRCVVPQRGSLESTRATTLARSSALRSRRMAGTLCGYPARVSVATRVIPCLDVDAGRVVKGVNFENLRDAGDPVELAAAYDAEGADELTFLDVTACSSGRATIREVVKRTAEHVRIPLTVGGGVRSDAEV